MISALQFYESQIYRKELIATSTPAANEKSKMIFALFQRSHFLSRLALTASRSPSIKAKISLKIKSLRKV